MYIWQLYGVPYGMYNLSNILLAISPLFCHLTSINISTPCDRVTITMSPRTSPLELVLYS